jgi:apolipoprotein N-acyltransferase
MAAKRAPNGLQAQRATPAGRTLLALATTLLFGVSFSSDCCGPLVWAAFIPLRIATAGCPPVKAFLLSAGAILPANLSFVWWLPNGLASYTGASPLLVWSLLTGYCLYHALPYGFAAAVSASALLGRPAAGSFVTAACFALCIHFQPALLPFTPVNCLADWPLMLQPLSVGGPALLLLMIFWVNELAARLIVALYRGAAYGAKIAALVLAGLLVAGYGGWRLQAFDHEKRTAAEDRFVTIAAIQPDIPVGGLGDVPPCDRSNNLDTLLSMSRERLEKGPVDLVVWPETPVYTRCSRVHARRPGIRRLVEGHGTALLLNCGDRQQGNRFYSALFSAPGFREQRYDKQVLVPFGEYLPFGQQLPFLHSWFPDINNTIPGPRTDLFGLRPGIRIIPSICYEILFPSLVRRFVHAGGNLLVNISDDAWFRRTEGSRIHLSFCPLRAAEYGLPLVRATNSGISAAIQASGRFVPGSRTPLFQKDARVHRLYVPVERTLYAGYGCYLPLGLAMLVLWRFFCRRGSRQPGGVPPASCPGGQDLRAP